VCEVVFWPWSEEGGRGGLWDLKITTEVKAGGLVQSERILDWERNKRANERLNVVEEGGCKKRGVASWGSPGSIG